MNFSNIDAGAFCEAISPKTNLLFDDEKQQANFELGVSMMIYKWDALDVAVSNNWGGPDSAEKRDWISTIVIELFQNNKFVDVQMIEEVLLYAMVDEFETNVEDDSSLPIAAGIIEIWKHCAQNDYSIPQALYQAWTEKQKTQTGPRRVEIVNDPLNGTDTSDESEDDYDDDEDMAVDQEGDLDMDQESKNEPIIDDDGFELVQPKGRR
ncbi:hypothetical protein ACO0QE_001838 [Hanseniaspora vineae]